MAKVDAYPMPRIEDTLDKIGPVEVITTLDLVKWYWQVPLSPQSKKLTVSQPPLACLNLKLGYLGYTMHQQTSGTS